MNLDSRICSQARLSRDPRYDGRFFIGVRSTRIYCRSICPVRTVKEQNVGYFPTAAAASEEGYRHRRRTARRWTNANLLRGGSISLLVAGDRNFRAQLPARQWGRINQPQSDRGIWSAVTCNRFCRATKKRRLVGALQKKPFGSIRFYLLRSSANLQFRIARSSWLCGRGPQPHRASR